jgi:hypothetical protein
MLSKHLTRWILVTKWRWNGALGHWGVELEMEMFHETIQFN